MSPRLAAPAKARMALPWIVLLALLLVGPGPVAAVPDPDAACPGCNLVLVSVDTLRADHLPCYGYARDTAPAVCRFFENGWRFLRARSQSPWTGPSHATLFTSLFPYQHGVDRGPEAPRVRPRPSLFSILRENGWWTAASHGGGYVDQALRPDHLDALRSGKAMTFRRDLVANFDALVKGRAPDQPFAYFLHGYDVHLDYKPTRNWFAEPDPTFDRRVEENVWCQWEDLPDGSRRIDPQSVPADPAARDYLVSLYDSEIRDVDRALARLFAHLEATGLLATTVVVFTSDHGEELFERGSCDHVKTLHRELLHVPLLLRVPLAPALTSRTLVDANLALLPTLLELLGVAPDAPLEGESLVPIVRAETTGRPLPAGRADRTAFASTRFRYAGETLQLFAAERGCQKVILDAARGRVQRYDVCADPDETRPRPPPFSSASVDLEAELRRHVARALANEAPGDAALDCATLEQLAALGYVDEETLVGRCHPAGSPVDREERESHP